MECTGFNADNQFFVLTQCVILLPIHNEQFRRKQSVLCQDKMVVQISTSLQNHIVKRKGPFTYPCQNKKIRPRKVELIKLFFQLFIFVS